MKTKAKFILLCLLAFLVGSAFATPLLISELEIVPFWTIPLGPNADFTASIIYANFSIQNDLPRNDVNLGDYYESNLDYFFVLNITNLSNIEAKLSGLYFAGVKNTTITPCAIGGFHSTHQSGWKYSGRYGPLEGYLGHICGGRVEELWLDGKLYNKTWVPEGGLEEIWRSQNIFGVETGLQKYDLPGAL